jgi:transposase
MITERRLCAFGQLRQQGGWELEVVERDTEAKGFAVVPKRWTLERTFGW